VALGQSKSIQIASSLNAWLPFLLYSMLSVVLMLVDNRFSVSSVIRNQASALLSPVWWLASRPYSVWLNVNTIYQSNQGLRNQLAVLEDRQLKSDIAIKQMAFMQSENTALRTLLSAKQRLNYNARLVELVSMNADPSQKRFVIDSGANFNVHVGQVVIDARGLIGQVSEVYAQKSLVISITDADHALPVIVSRSGFRSIVFGQGKDQILSLANLTPSDDIKVGDVLLTSGVGGRFPAGIPVGVVKQFKQDEALAFISAQVKPYARIAYGRQFLLLDVIKEPAIQIDTINSPVIGNQPAIKPMVIKP
jgi:rod shape-determining protein MreC